MMTVKLDVTPDFVGFFKRLTDNPLQKDFNLFLMYMDKPPVRDLTKKQTGTIIDNLGLSKFDCSMDHKIIEFRKEYIEIFPNFSQIPIEGKILYKGSAMKTKEDKYFFEGNWKKDHLEGIFVLGDFYNSLRCKNPIGKNLIEEETFKLVEKIKELIKEFPYTPPINKTHLTSE